MDLIAPSGAYRIEIHFYLSGNRKPRLPYYMAQ